MKKSFSMPQIKYSIFETEDILTDSSNVTAAENVTAQLAVKADELNLTTTGEVLKFTF